MILHLFDHLFTQIKVDPAKIAVNENGMWLTFSVVKVGDRLHVHAAFPKGAIVTETDELTKVDVELPARFAYGTHPITGAAVFDPGAGAWGR